jgi:hypothetical protein
MIMAKDHFLVATDERFPITIALDHAFATGQISPELVAVRKKELIDLVSEAAKTFGFQAKTTLASALDMSLGLLSLALVAGTRGEMNPNKWAARIVSDGWKSLVKEAIGMSRQIKEKDEAYDYLFENDRDPRILREHLREFALRRDKKNQWMGYHVFTDYRESREQSQRLDAMVRWLIRSLVKRNPPWIKDPIDGPTGTDEALNTLLFRASTGLGFKQKDIILTPEEFANVRKQHDAAPVSWLKKAHDRYKEVRDSLPPELRPGLDEKWCHRQFKKGPPKIKNWEADDLPGVIGVYYYQVYL